MEGLGEDFKPRYVYENLSQNMFTTLSAYLETWRLKLNHTETVTAAFHLNNERPSVSKSLQKR